MKKVLIAFFCLSIGSSAVVYAQDKKNTVVSPTTPPVPPTPAGAPTPPPPPVPAPPAPPKQEVDPKAGKFQFKEETHDYGEVMEGPLAECDFEFKNVGKKPIVITEAHGSCGCTVPSWPHEPILPKQTGKIHVAYTTNGRVGMISKEVTINSNAQQSPMVLHIRGTVKAKPAEAAAPSAPATH